MPGFSEAQEEEWRIQRQWEERQEKHALRVQGRHRLKPYGLRAMSCLIWVIEVENRNELKLRQLIC